MNRRDVDYKFLSMADLKLHRGHLQMAAILLLAILIAITPISSKAVNLAWILLFLMACSLMLTRAFRRGPVKLSEGVSSALRALILFFLAGFALQVVMRLYWGEPVRGLSFEITSLTAAWVALIATRYWQPLSLYRVLLACGLVFASLLALAQGYGYMFKGINTPTNAVNWAAGLALLMCLSVAVAIDYQAQFREKTLSALGVGVFSLAIFVAGRKGAFFAILWAAAVGMYFFLGSAWREPRKLLCFMTSIAFSFAAILVLILATDWFEVPIKRVVIAAAEFSEVIHREKGSGTVLKGTVGGRIHMHEIGIEATSESPLVGIGAIGRDHLVKRAELDLQEPLFHLHSEYLQSWVAYGVPGLLGALSFSVGLVVAGFFVRRDAPAIAVALGGLGVVHFLSGLSNVNSFHNYYGTVFAVCVVIPFLVFGPKPRAVPCDPGWEQ
jgi:O-antigen ligase